ncbi:polycystin-1-like protein 2 [Glandiceps talaboti]
MDLGLSSVSACSEYHFCDDKLTYDTVGRVGITEWAELAITWAGDVDIHADNVGRGFMSRYKETKEDSNPETVTRFIILEDSNQMQPVDPYGHSDTVTLDTHTSLWKKPAEDLPLRRDVRDVVEGSGDLITIGEGSGDYGSGDEGSGDVTTSFFVTTPVTNTTTVVSSTLSVNTSSSTGFQVDIECQDNCYRRGVSTSASMTLQAVCSNCPTTVFYEWSISYRNAQYLFEDVQTDDSFSDTGFSSEYLVINADQLDDGLMYKLQINVSHSDGRYSVNTWRFTTDASPTGGYAVTTNFRVQCSNWNDTDTPLTYSVFSRPKGLAITTFQYSGTNETSSNFLLSMGIASYNYEVELTVVISDTLNSETRQILIVTVETPPVSGDYIDIVSNLTSGNNNLLDDMIRAGNSAEAVSLVITVATLLNSGSANSTGDTNDNYFDDRTSLRSTVIEGLKTLSDTSLTIEDVSQVATALTMVTSVGDELNGDSQVNSADTLASLSSNLVSMRNESKTKIMAAADAISGCCANVLSVTMSSTSSSSSSTVTKSIVQTINSVSSSILYTKVPGQTPVIFNTSSFSLELQRNYPASIGGSSMSMSGGTFTLPSSQNLFRDNPNNSFIDTQLLGFSGNPYNWDNSSAYITSDVITLSFIDENNAEMSISDLDEDITLEMFTGRDLGPIQWLNLTYESVNEEDITLVVYQLPARANTSIHFLLTPNDSSWENVNYTLYFSHGRIPTVLDYDFLGVLPNTEYNNDSGLADDIRLEMEKTFFIPYEYQTEDGNDYYVGVKADLGTFDFGIQTFTSGCRFWDVAFEQWDSYGCQVSPNTYHAITYCRCNHLTAFGSDFVLPPNTIDFSTVFEKFTSLHENLVVFITVGLIFVIYVLILIWARRKDRRDVERWGVTPMVDNKEEDKFIYQISVYTGLKSNAGTNSRVFLVLNGKNDRTEVRLLSGRHRQAFHRGSVSTFVMSVPQSLGDLVSVRIWHDYSGTLNHGSWFLNKIIVSDIQTKEHYSFECEQWLSVEEGDRQVQRLLTVSTKANRQNIGRLFSRNAQRDLSDGHLWMSVMSRPSQRPFTLSWHVVYVGIMSSLVVFPVHLLIVLVFRKSRPKKTVRKNQVSSSNVFGTAKGVASNEESDDVWRGMKRQASQVSDEGSLFEAVKSRREARLSTVDVDVPATPSRASNRNMDSRGRSNDDLDIVDVESGNEARKKSTCMLPHWCVYIAWCLVFLSSLASAFFTVLYSMEWGHDRSVDWLFSFLTSFVQDLIILQPFKVLLFAFLLTLIFRKSDGCDEPQDLKLKDDEYYIHDIETEDGIIKYVPPSSELPGGDILEKTLERRTREKEMGVLVKDIVINIVFIVLLCIVAFTVRSPDSYYMHQAVDQSLFQNDNFAEIESGHDGFWNWVSNTLLASLYPTQWYNGDQLTTDEMQYTDNLASYRVGPPRIRQLRVREGLCTVLSPFTNLISACIAEYSLSKEDGNDYYDLWSLTNNNTGNSDNNYTWWQHDTIGQTDGVPMYGIRRMFGGGGYVSEIGTSLDGAQNTTDDLQTSSWLDRYTRAVFVEFPLYNANVNLFSMVTLLVEFPATGASLVYRHISVLRLYTYVGTFWAFYLISELITVLFVMYYIIREILNLKKLGCAYFKSFWTWMKMIKLCLCLAAIGVHIYTTVYWNFVTDDVSGRSADEFLNLQRMAIWDEIYLHILAVVIFISFFEFIDMLRFSRTISLLAKTFRHASKDYICFAIIFFIILMAYSQLAYVALGSNLEAFKSMLATFETLISLRLGMFDYDGLENANRILGPLVLITFIIVMFSVLATMFIAIMIRHFHVIKAESNGDDGYEIVDFLMEQFKDILGIGSDPEDMMKKLPKDLSFKSHLKQQLPTLAEQEAEAEDDDDDDVPVADMFVEDLNEVEETQVRSIRDLANKKREHDREQRRQSLVVAQEDTAVAVTKFDELENRLELIEGILKDYEDLGYVSLDEDKEVRPKVPRRVGSKPKKEDKPAMDSNEDVNDEELSNLIQELELTALDEDHPPSVVPVWQTQSGPLESKYQVDKVQVGPRRVCYLCRKKLFHPSQIESHLIMHCVVNRRHRAHLFMRVAELTGEISSYIIRERARAWWSYYKSNAKRIKLTYIGKFTGELKVKRETLALFDLPSPLILAFCQIFHEYLHDALYAHWEHMPKRRARFNLKDFAMKQK